MYCTYTLSVTHPPPHPMPRAGVAAGLMFMVTHPEEMTHIAVAEEGGTKYA